jgi:hypothetical protein
MSLVARMCAFSVLCLGARCVFAQSDPDIDRIPEVVSPQTGEAPAVNRSLYWQSDLTYNSPRNDLIVPLSPPALWEARTFLDLRLDHRIDENVSVSYSGRVNARAQQEFGFPIRENFRNDLREAYATWTDNRGWFAQLGRINLKSGVAEGFNPTDYFKTRAVVEPTSIDPAVLREDRLGVVMLQTQWIGAIGSLTFAVAPKLADDSPPYNGNALPSLSPMLDRTNARWRALVKANITTPNGISPELLIYEESGNTRIGFNVNKGVGRSAVLYLEWSGGRQASVIDAAYEDGRRAGVLPTVPAISIDTGKAFANNLAAGLSYTTQAGINLAIEFEYTQAGFSAADWRHWFSAGRAGGGALAGELWFIRGYAGEQQEPVARQGFFLRAYWQNALVKNLTLSAFVIHDVHDGSFLAQGSADYYLSPRWSLGAIIDAYGGARQSDFGSVPQRGSALLKMTRFL